MERLTSRQAIKHSDGTEHIETYCHGHRYGPAAFSQKWGSSDKQEYKNYCEMVDRLAAYEDAGLEPSEIPTGLELAKVFAAMQELKHLQQENEQLREQHKQFESLQTPQEANEYDCCPRCSTYLKDDNGVAGLYCPNCGQKIKCLKELGAVL